MADSPKSKRKKENLNDGLIDTFLKWCKDVGLTLSKKVLFYANNCINLTDYEKARDRLF